MGAHELDPFERWYMGATPKMVGFPNKPMGFPTKNDHFGVEIGGTTIQGNTHIYLKHMIP